MDENIKKLAQLINGIRFGMLTTIENDGTLHSRPMAMQQIQFDGDIWFFTNDPSAKVDEIRHDAHVCLAFVTPEENRYISVSGRAQVVHDNKKAQELWTPALKAWFPEGLKDPSLALLKVSVYRAEYWDVPSGKAVKLIGYVKALATGQPYLPGTHEKIDVRH